MRSSEIDDTRPTVIFAYTIKGNGLPSAGHPQNHSNLLKPEQLALVAEQLGEDVDDPWRGFAADSPMLHPVRPDAARLRRTPLSRRRAARRPPDFGREVKGHSSTQQALGRLLLDLTRLAPEAARRVVTVAPDVASTTNLGGWVNKAGVWSSTEKRDWFADDAETILHWDERPTGQHIELGIAEVNLVSLLGELGATWSRWGEPVLPIGTLYDPFVTRALEPWSFGVYGGGQSILIGTPSGVTLAAEGGAHQSIITPSIGIEQPGVVVVRTGVRAGLRVVHARRALAASADPTARPATSGSPPACSIRRSPPFPPTRLRESVVAPGRRGRVRDATDAATPRHAGRHGRPHARSAGRCRSADGDRRIG